MTFNGSSWEARILIEIPWIPLDAPLKNEQGNRSPERYFAIINQFMVESNPRYKPRDGKTYCNIFVWDVTCAMNAEIPHWVNSTGVPCQPNSEGSHRVNCNEMFKWLHAVGENYGWQNVDILKATESATKGLPTIAIHRNTSGNGHVAMLMPYCTIDSGLMFSQAGRRCFANGSFEDSFAGKSVEFWTHD